MSNLKIGDSISWTQTDQALPLPLDLKDPLVNLALSSSDFIDALDREMLEISNLSKPAYELRINSKSVGGFFCRSTHAWHSFSGTVDPMLEQALKVHSLTQEHNKVHCVRWRDIHIPYAEDASPELAQTKQILDKSEQKLIQEQKVAAQPGTFHYELIPKP